MTFSNQRAILIFIIIILLLISSLFYLSGLLIFGSITGLEDEVHDLHSQFNLLVENFTNSNFSSQTTTTTTKLITTNPTNDCVEEFIPSILPSSIDASIFKGLNLM